MIPIIFSAELCKIIGRPKVDPSLARSLDASLRDLELAGSVLLPSGLRFLVLARNASRPSFSRRLLASLRV